MRTLLTILAALTLCVPVKAASISIPFTAIVDSIETFYNPGDTLYKFPVVPVSIGTVLTGALSWTNDYNSGTLGLGAQGGNFYAGDSHPGPYPVGKVTFAHETAQRYIGLDLIGGVGSQDWRSGTFYSSSTSGYPYSWYRFSATLVQIPDTGSTVGMLGSGFGLLVLLRRFRAAGR
jgi:hypothetical protein